MMKQLTTLTGSFPSPHSIDLVLCCEVQNTRKAHRMWSRAADTLRAVVNLMFYFKVKTVCFYFLSPAMFSCFLGGLECGVHCN